MKSPGRPQTYGDDYDHIIKQVVDAKRALQQCASAKQIQDAMKAARLKPLPCEMTISRRKIELGIIKVDVKFKPQLTAKLMGERKEKAQEIIDVNADPKKLCVSYDESNFHEADAVPLGACYEVFPEDKDDVPIEIQFANADKETTTQHMKLMFGMASCPAGGVYFKELDYKAWNTKEKTGKKGAGQDFMVAKKIWRDIKMSTDKLYAPGQKPFLILDKAPGHVGKKSQAELDEWWGKVVQRMMI